MYTKKVGGGKYQDEELELEDFTQNPDPVLLHKHLLRRYPGAVYKIGYDAGFSGFSMQQILAQQESCQCWVVNAADIPAKHTWNRRN